MEKANYEMISIAKGDYHGRENWQLDFGVPDFHIINNYPLSLSTLFENGAL